MQTEQAGNILVKTCPDWSRGTTLPRPLEQSESMAASHTALFQSQPHSSHSGLLATEPSTARGHHSIIWKVVLPSTVLEQRLLAFALGQGAGPRHRARSAEAWSASRRATRGGNHRVYQQTDTENVSTHRAPDPSPRRSGCVHGCVWKR